MVGQRFTLPFSFVEIKTRSQPNLDLSYDLGYNQFMKKVSKGNLKAKMFEYLREIEQKGEPLIVTDYGKPVLKIVPYVEKRDVSEMFADLRSKAKLPKEAVLESTQDEWESV